jgi:hypothetical protein
MKSFEVFGVAVKAVGLYFIVQGIYRLLQIFDVIVPLMMGERRLDSFGRGTIGAYLFAALLHFAISAFFLKCSDWLVGLAYPRQQKLETEE